MSDTANVTTQTLHEATRSDTDQPYRDLFETNPQPIWIFEVETLRFLAVNTAAISYYGYSRQEFLGMTMRDLLLPEDIPLLESQLAPVPKFLDTMRTWRHYTKAGVLLHVYVAHHCVNFEGHNAVFGLVNDITEGIQTEQALREDEAVLRGLYEIVPLDLGLLEVEGDDFRLLSVNHATAKFVGERRHHGEEGRCARAMGTPDEVVDLWIARLKEAERTGEPERFEFERDMEGGVLHMRAYVAWVGAREGRARFAFAVEDITEFKRIEKKVRESDERAVDFFDNLADGFIGYNRQWRITYANGVAATSFQQPREALSGRVIWDLFPDLVGSAYAAACHQAMHESVPVHREDYWPRFDAWFENHIFPIDDGIAILFRNISERKQLEAERDRHIAEIERLNERLRQAIQETHHRVKNNLQILAALVDLQTMEGRQVLPASEFERLSQHIRALAAVHDVLTVQRKDERDEGVSIRVILQKLLPILQQIVGESRLSYTLDDAMLPIQQASSLALCTNELISNAVKHGRGEVRLVFIVRADTATLQVSDNGPGFPADFDPDTAANTGLQLIRNLVSWDLGGKVTFDNGEDCGAQVTICLPLAYPAPVSEIPEKPISLPEGRPQCDGP